MEEGRQETKTSESDSGLATEEHNVRTQGQTEAARLRLQRFGR